MIRPLRLTWFSGEGRRVAGVTHPLVVYGGDVDFIQRVWKQFTEHELSDMSI